MYLSSKNNNIYRIIKKVIDTIQIKKIVMKQFDRQIQEACNIAKGIHPELNEIKPSKEAEEGFNQFFKSLLKNNSIKK